MKLTNKRLRLSVLIVLASALFGLQHMPVLAADPLKCECINNTVNPPTVEGGSCVCCDYECACSGGATPNLTSSTECTAATTSCEYSCNPPAASTSEKTQPFTTYSLESPLKAKTIPDVIGRVVSMFIGVVGSFALLMFIYGGLTLLTSRGNPEQVQKGKQIFVWATIGLVVIFSAYLVLTNVFRIIGATD